ncbi:MAG: ComEC/Rec2 family competence protein [Pyrinomonadaceae bacterium]
MTPDRHGRVELNFSHYPVLWLATSFAAGIAFTFYQNVDLVTVLWLSSAFALLALLCSQKGLATAVVLIAFAAAGAAASVAEQLSVRPDRLRTLYDKGELGADDPVYLEGILAGAPEASVEGSFLTIESEAATHHGVTRKVSGVARLYIPKEIISDNYPLQYGSRIRAATRLSRDDEYLNPGVLSKKVILDRLGVDVTGSVKSSLLIERVAEESVFLPLAWIYNQRGRLISDFRTHLDQKTAAVMTASLLGNKHFLDKPTADLFREGGTFHILVISGLHITIIGGLFLLILRQITRNRSVHFLGAAMPLWGYTLAVGADVPVVRAAIMFTVILFSYALYRRGTLLNTLGVCGLLLLAWRPSDLFNPSFQLTFVSVAAIAGFAYPLMENLRNIGRWRLSAQTPFPPRVPQCVRRFCETLYWNPEVWDIESRRQIWTAHLIKSPYLPKYFHGLGQKGARFLFEGLVVSAIVQLFMLPLLVVYFHRVSFSSIALNLWVSIFIGLESFSAVLGIFIAKFSSLLAAPFFVFAETFNSLMLSVPRLFVGLGWASFRLPSYSEAGMIIYFLYAIPIIYLVLMINHWDPMKLVPSRRPIVTRSVILGSLGTLMGLLLLICFHPFSAPGPDGRLHIDFLDVGQGDSALVTFPDGRTMLIDGGGRVQYKRQDDSEEDEPFEPDVRTIGEAVVSEFLWDRGLSRLDHIVATHADADHMQGLVDVARNFDIGTAILGDMAWGDLNFEELKQVLDSRAIPVESVQRGMLMQFGDVIVEVLNPDTMTGPNRSSNNNSIVLRISFGNRSLLMTGDIERAVEEDMLREFPTLHSDVVKVPHHGSRTSSTAEFINAVSGKVAVISVGRRSPFGHPHAEVVQRWTNAGVSVLTTGAGGTISIVTDGQSIEISTYRRAEMREGADLY